MVTKYTFFICRVSDSQLDLKTAGLREAAALHGTTIAEASCPKPGLVNTFELDFSLPQMSSINQA